jgi:hypothetical protein
MAMVPATNNMRHKFTLMLLTSFLVSRKNSNVGQNDRRQNKPYARISSDMGKDEDQGDNGDQKRNDDQGSAHVTIRSLGVVD